MKKVHLLLLLFSAALLTSPLLGQDCVECHKKQTLQSLREIQTMAAEPWPKR